jgi:hypothetical protein
MSNPTTWETVKSLWLVPEKSWLILVNDETGKLTLIDDKED